MQAAPEELGLRGARELRDAVRKLADEIAQGSSRLKVAAEEQGKLLKSYVRGTWALVVLTGVLALVALVQLLGMAGK